MLCVSFWGGPLLILEAEPLLLVVGALFTADMTICEQSGLERRNSFFFRRPTQSLHKSGGDHTPGFEVIHGIHPDSQRPFVQDNELKDAEQSLKYYG